ncbi:MAG TPA: LamG domain-containing protein, partial [Sedimentisphaerales bacterium]|nr:LamG domain-containing protein [Sedimentisphaerales bacterium]
SIEKQVTIAFWAYGDAAAQPQAGFIFGAFQDPAVSDSRVASSHCPWSNGTVYFDTGGTAPASGYDRISKAATPAVYEGSWQHWTFTKDADTGEQSIYLDGALWHSGSGMTRTMTGVTAFTIGCRPDLANYYVGMMDDFRLYDRALSPEEVAGLAGVTKPFDKPF